MILAEVLEQLADVVLGPGRVPARKQPGAAHLGVDVLALQVVVQNGLYEPVDTEPVRIVRALDDPALVGRVVDHEIHVGMSNRCGAYVLRVGVDAVEARQRKALVHTDERLSQLLALLDEGIGDGPVIEPPTHSIRPPRRVAFPAVVSVRGSHALHVLGLEIPAVVRRHLTVLDHALAARRVSVGVGIGVCETP